MILTAHLALVQMVAIRYAPDYIPPPPRVLARVLAWQFVYSCCFPAPRQLGPWLSELGQVTQHVSSILENSWFVAGETFLLGGNSRVV